MTRHHAGISMMAVGLAAVFFTFWATAHYLFPFYPHTYPFAWYGLIIFLDGLLWCCWKDGLILRRPREFGVLLFWSAVFWFFFEAWNLRLKNWYYVGTPSGEIWPHVEAYIDFATVLPGMFLVYRLLCRMGIPRRVRTAFALKGPVEKACLAAGALMVLLPLAFPDYFFPLVWGAFVLLFEPVCERFGARSLLVDAKAGEWTSLVRLVIAGILCGAYWELANFWSLEKWVYTVPLFSEGKLFEMPYLGFLGFAPFSVECFVMINALYLLRGGRHWDPDAPQPSSFNTTPESEKVFRTIHRAAYSLAIAGAVFFCEWSYARMDFHTVESAGESIGQALQDISARAADNLQEKGWRYPKEVLDNWNEAGDLISPDLRQRVRRRLELASLLNIGSNNAMLLEAAGVDSQEKLAQQDPDPLLVRLTAINRELHLRARPLLKRRVISWISAAGRQSALF